MASLDFSNTKAVEAWFASKSPDVRCAMTSRAALRVLANVGRAEADRKERIVLRAMRANLTSAGLGMGKPGVVKLSDNLVKRLKRAATLSASSELTLSTVDAAARSALSAATISAESVARSPRSSDLALSAAESVAGSVAAAANLASTRAAALFAESAIRSALSHDTDLSPEVLSRVPLWELTDVPLANMKAHHNFLEYLNSHPDWAFFRQWYEQMWEGAFRDWPLAIKVALINPELWEGEDALAKVAAEIRRLEKAREERDTLPPEVTKARAAVLLRSASANALAAHGLWQLLTLATDAYRREVSNALPDAFEPLDVLPGVLGRIASILCSDAAETEREEQLQDALRLCANTIAALNRRLVATHADMEAAKDGQDQSRPVRLFADAFYTKAGEGAAGLITSKILWGGLIGCGTLLYGGSADALLDQLGQCYEMIIELEAPSVVPRLPPVTDL